MGCSVDLPRMFEMRTARAQFLASSILCSILLDLLRIHLLNTAKTRNPVSIEDTGFSPGAGCEIRTRDLMITNQALYRLS